MSSVGADRVMLRPSTVAAAARQDSEGEKQPLKLKYPQNVKRAIKAHAARKGMHVADYFLQLAKADGLQLDE